MYKNFVESPKRALSPRYQEFKDKATIVPIESSPPPPPLPMRRESYDVRMHQTTPPPPVPSRRESASSGGRKFFERKKRRESLSSLETKYRRMSTHHHHDDDPSMQVEEIGKKKKQQQQQQQQVDIAREERNRRRVHHIYQEMCETEAAYVKDLDVIVTKYLIPLRQQINLGHMGISKEQGNNAVDVIFTNVDAVRTANKLLLEQLVVRVTEEEEEDDEEDEDDEDEESKKTTHQDANHDDSDISTASRISTAFLNVVDQFQIYTIYCVGYQKGMQRLYDLREQHPMIHRFLQKCRREDTRSTDAVGLQSLLIKPVQRICKYPLFFRDLLRHFNESDDREGGSGSSSSSNTVFSTDRERLIAAAAAVEQVSIDVNHKVKLSDQSQAVVRASLRLQGTASELVEPGRRLLLEDTIQMQHESKLRIKYKHYSLLVFNDLFMLARPAETKILRSVAGSSGEQKLKQKYAWGMKNVTMKGETGAYDRQHGWPFYVMLSVSVNNGERVFGTSVERKKLFAETEMQRRMIFQIVEECKKEQMKES